MHSSKGSNQIQFMRTVRNSTFFFRHKEWSGCFLQKVLFLWKTFLYFDIENSCQGHKFSCYSQVFFFVYDCVRSGASECRGDGFIILAVERTQQGPGAPRQADQPTVLIRTEKLRETHTLTKHWYALLHRILPI